MLESNFSQVLFVDWETRSSRMPESTIQDLAISTVATYGSNRSVALLIVYDFHILVSWELGTRAAVVSVSMTFPQKLEIARATYISERYSAPNSRLLCAKPIRAEIL
jgi:hypothetical protein